MYVQVVITEEHEIEFPDEKFSRDEQVLVSKRCFSDKGFQSLTKEEQDKVEEMTDEVYYYVKNYLKGDMPTYRDITYITTDDNDQIWG
jgi:hypothetical protein